MFFVFGCVLSERLSRVFFCELQPSTLTARSSCRFVRFLKRKILIQFNNTLFQLGLKRFHFREIFCFKAMGSLRVFGTRNKGTLIICLPEHVIVVSKPFIDGFGGLVVSMLASGSRVRGFDPDRIRWSFSDVKKILSMPSFGGEVK
jgi:hypothetical protein